MATVGNTTTPSGTVNAYLLNVTNAMAFGVTMPGPGLITSISCYFAAANGHGNTTAALCIWQFSGGALLAQSSNFTLTPGSGGRGGQSWITQTITTPSGGLRVTNGQQLYIGWWRFANGSMEWTEDAGSTEYQNGAGGDLNNSSPPSSESFVSHSGLIGAYVTYTPGGVAYARRLSGWSGGVNVPARRSSAWPAGQDILVRRLGAWVSGT